MIQIQVPRKLKPLLAPRRYKGAYGGRGGAKSHFFAEQGLIRCVSRPTRMVCIREVQNSIRDSVRQLMTDKIAALGLTGFDVLESEVRGPHGSMITFKGMQHYNADNIKSLEGFDIAWVEEAQTLSQRSLDMLRPTLRKEDSELWFSWNPRYKTDPVDAFFRKNPPQDAVSVQINWRDNPWFPQVLAREMAHDFETDPDKAEHIWNGAYGFGQGSILARWLSVAERTGRITRVAPDPFGAAIHITSDIGFRDTAGWWFWQPCLGGFRVIKYVGASGWDADDWIIELQKHIKELGVALAKIWLPQDARAKTFQSKHSAVEKFLAAFGPTKVEIVPPVRVSDRINAARNVLPKCEFDRDLCEDGLDGLRAWEFEFNEDTGAFSRDPVHNWASHPGDAFSYGATVLQEILPKQEETEKPIRGLTVGANTVTLNEMWATTIKQTERF